MVLRHGLTTIASEPHPFFLLAKFLQQQFRFLKASHRIYHIINIFIRFSLGDSITFPGGEKQQVWKFLEENCVFFTTYSLSIMVKFIRADDNLLKISLGTLQKNRCRIMVQFKNMLYTVDVICGLEAKCAWVKYIAYSLTESHCDISYGFITFYEKIIVIIYHIVTS